MSNKRADKIRENNEAENQIYSLKLQHYMINWDSDNFNNKYQEYEELNKFLNTRGTDHIPPEILPKNKAQEKMYLHAIEVLDERFEDLRKELIADGKYENDLENYARYWDPDKFESKAQEYKELHKFLNTRGTDHIPPEILPKNKAQEEVYDNFIEKLSNRADKIENKMYAEKLEDYIFNKLDRGNFSNRREEYKALDKFLNTPENRLPQDILPANKAQDKIYYNAVEQLNNRAEALEAGHKKSFPPKNAEISFNPENIGSSTHLPRIDAKKYNNTNTNTKSHREEIKDKRFHDRGGNNNYSR